MKVKVYSMMADMHLCTLDLEEDVIYFFPNVTKLIKERSRQQNYFTGKVFILTTIRQTDRQERKIISFSVGYLELYQIGYSMVRYPLT